MNTVDTRVYIESDRVTDNPKGASKLFKIKGETITQGELTRHPELRKFSPEVREQDKKARKKAANKQAKTPENKGG